LNEKVIEFLNSNKTTLIFLFVSLERRDAQKESEKRRKNWELIWKRRKKRKIYFQLKIGLNMFLSF